MYVDGQPMGMIPLTPLELPVEEHIVQVKNREPGEEQSFRVMVKPNEVHSLDVNLLKKEQFFYLVLTKSPTWMVTRPGLRILALETPSSICSKRISP
ncbi:MAG: hypothetical protein ACE5I8_12040, partial [Thermodesulfobacteriota bacterium]